MKVQVRKGYKAKTIDKDLLPEYLKDGWGEVKIGKKKIAKKVKNFKDGEWVEETQMIDDVKIVYAQTPDALAKDAEIERLKAELAKQKN